MTYLQLKEVTKLVGHLADLIRGSVGETGLSVMISTKSPRQILITKVFRFVTCPTKYKKEAKYVCSAPMMREIA